MSQYDFMAADNKLKPLEIGVEDNRRIVIIQNEDYMLGIYDDEPSNYTDPFTDLPSIMNVQIGDFDNVKSELFDYVKDALKINDTKEETTEVQRGHSSLV